LYGASTIEEDIKILENINFSKFMAFKSKFFRHLKYKWFITGHLDQERALKIFEIAKSSVKSDFLSEDDILVFKQMIKLP